MGNTAPQVKTAGATQLRDPLIYIKNDFPKLIKKNELGTGKFMKSFLCKTEEGIPVVVKVYVLHDGESQEELKKARDGIEQIFVKLSKVPHPNVLPYQRAVIGGQVRQKNCTSAGYVIRQHFFTSLNDRLSTRPFLSPMEKKWIIYQLFQAVSQCHASGVCHGDIKTENTMVTSWTWIILTDFASFKPTYLPEDDPSDYNHFFASSGGTSQHRCYLAPERFYSSTAEAETEASFKGLDPKLVGGGGSKKGGGGGEQLDPSMDIFSLGCVIAEVFLGTPVLDLPMLLQYRACQDELSQPLLDKLNKLEKMAGPEITNLVKNMLSRDPLKRKTAEDYLKRCETLSSSSSSSPIFPSSLKFLFRFFSILQSDVHTPDDRILFVCRHYRQIMSRCGNFEDEEGAAFFSHYAPPDLNLPGNNLGAAYSDEGNAANDFSSSSSNRSHLSSFSPRSSPRAPRSPRKGQYGDDMRESLALDKDAKGVTIIDELDVLAKETHDLIDELESGSPFSLDSSQTPPPLPPLHAFKALEPSSTEEDRDEENGLIMVAQLVCASLRHVRQPQCKLLALQLLLRFGRHLNDEARLQRLVPFIMTLLDDQIAVVRASAVRVVRDLLALVTRFPASDADIFPKYIFLAMQKLPADPEELVRIAFAESIAGIAESSRRFLEISHCQQLAQQSDIGGGVGVNNNNDNVVKNTPATESFEEKLTSLHNSVSKWIHDLFGDMDGSMGNISASLDSAIHGNRSNLVKRALLRDITRLCVFFGSSVAEIKIAPLLVTMVNDGDWELRYALCANIPSLSALLGSKVTRDLIILLLDLCMESLEELVLSRTLKSLATITELGLLPREVVLERVEKTGPLLLHPNSWVRHAVATFIAAVARRLGPADAMCFLFPAISPYFAIDLASLENVSNLSQEEVSLAALTPLSRNTFKLELLRIANDYRNTANQPPTPMDQSITYEERARLKIMEKYLKSAAQKLIPKSGGNTSSSRSNVPPSSENGVASSARHKLTQGGGEMSRLQYHSERLNATPSSSLFVPKSVTAAEVVGSRGNRVGERDALYPTLKALLNSDHLQNGAQSPASGQWWAPPELRDSGRLQALYGVTTNSRDAVKLARSAALSEDDNFDGGMSRDRSRRGAPVGSGGDGDGELARLRSVDVDVTSNGLSSPGGGSSSMRGSDRITLSEAVDSATLLRRIVALGLPPLPPDLGAPRRRQGGGDMSATSTSSLNGGGGAGVGGKGKEWRPKVGGVVVQTLVEHVPKEEHGGFKQGPMYSHEHAGAVNRLAVSPDHTFFVSSSSDSTSRVWGTAQLESNVAPRAAAVYAQQSGGILDACVVEGTRSVATASDAGDVHVWRVDLIHGSDKGSGSGSVKNGKGGAMGTAEVRRTELEKEGPVLAVAHVNSDSASMVLFATQRGYIHCWDLRSEVEPWKLRVNPELGFLTTLAVGSGSEKHWLCAGTSRGYILIWDMRFQLLVRLWRHSSKTAIYRLATCARLPEDPEGVAAAPLAFVAAGTSELAVWNLDNGGVCRRCFRTLSPQEGPHSTTLPTLDEVPIPAHPNAPILGASHAQKVLKEGFNSIGSGYNHQHSVRAIMGRISTNGNSYVITGSTDRHIRFWDMTTASKCFTVSGLEPGQPRPVYDSITTSPSSPEAPLFVCYDADVPSLDNVVSSHLPIREQRGLVVPSTSHNDAILDLKGIDLPAKMMLSSSRDGVVKCWK